MACLRIRAHIFCIIPMTSTCSPRHWDETKYMSTSHTISRKVICSQKSHHVVSNKCKWCAGHTFSQKVTCAQWPHLPVSNIRPNVITYTLHTTEASPEDTSGWNCHCNWFWRLMYQNSMYNSFDFTIIILMWLLNYGLYNNFFIILFLFFFLTHVAIYDVCNIYISNDFL